LLATPLQRVVDLTILIIKGRFNVLPQTLKGR